MRTWVIGLSFAFCPLYPLPLQAADSEPADVERSQPAEVEEIQVIGSPIIHGNSVDPYGGLKTVVGMEQISDLNAQDLGSVLRTTPGVNITRYNEIGSFGGGSGGAVFVRGLGSSRPGGEIQTFIDGVPVYNSVWNHPLLDLNPVGIAQSVEVYKGVQPARFGNTFSAINMDPKRRHSEGFETALSVGYGTYSKLVQTVEQGGKIGSFDYHVGQAYRSSDGHREDADGRLTDYHVRLGYQVAEAWEAGLFFLRTDSYAMDPGPDGRPAEKGGKYQTNQWLGTFSVGHHSALAEGEFKVYWNNGEGDWRDQAGPEDDTLNDWDLYGVRGKEALHLWEGGELLVGADLDYIVGDAEFTEDDPSVYEQFDSTRFRLLSPHMAVSHRLGDEQGWSLTASAGARYYNHSDFDSEWSPFGGLVLGSGATRLHASYARGVSYPGLNVVVFSEYVVPPLGSSWEDLDAETVDHFEVGVSHEFGPRLRVDVTAFYDDGEDRYVIVPPPPAPPTFENIEDFTTQGIEAALTLFPSSDISLFVGVTYLDPDPNDLPHAPAWTVSGGLNYRFLERFKLALDAQYVEEMHVGQQARFAGAENAGKVGSYLLLNGKLSYALPRGQRGVETEVFLAGDNLTDTDYEYQEDYPMPGATVMMGVDVRF